MDHSSVFSRAVIKFVSEADDWRRVGTTVLRLYLTARIGSAVLIWIFAGLVGRIFEEPTLAGMAEMWPAATSPFLFVLKLAVIGFFILFALLVLGEFSADEIASTRSLLRWRTAAAALPQKYFFRVREAD